MLTHEGKKIHAGAKGYGNYKRKGKIVAVELKGVQEKKEFQSKT